MYGPKVKLGLAPTRRGIFNREAAAKVKSAIESRLSALGIDFVNLDSVVEGGMLSKMADAPRAAEHLRSAGADAVFLLHCDFGSEGPAAKLCSLVGKPVLLWAARDEAPEASGRRIRDAQCGIFATAKALKRLEVPFTYIVNSWADGPEIEHGVKAFLRAVAAAKAVLGARVGQLSTRPAEFWSVAVNEGELLERFGVEIVPATLVAVESGVEKIVSSRDADFLALLADMRSRMRFVTSDERLPERIAALILWEKRWAAEEGLAGVAVHCWPDLARKLKIFPCIANGELAGAGLPAGCETDVLAVLTGVMMQAAAGAATFCADLTIRHPENENAELLWHCGPFPACLADEGVKRSVTGFGESETGAIGLGQWRIRGGALTVGRIGADHGRYSLFIGEAKGTEGPFNRGTYLWIEVSDWPRWEERLIYGPYIHHVTGVHGHVAPILHEACRYIPGLLPDAVEPEEPAIRAFWRSPGAL